MPEGLATLPMTFPDPLCLTPVGLRLPLVLETWYNMVSDPFTLVIIRQGYRIPFEQDSPVRYRFILVPLPRDPNRATMLLRHVEALLEKGAIRRVSVLEASVSLWFYSRFFQVTNKSGGWRPILDLSDLNWYVECTHFQMESQASILQAVHRGDWLVLVDLTDA